MSVRASNWAWGLECVSGTTKLVLMALADCANHEGACWPSLDTIRSKAVTSEATARRSIARLEELGLLIKEERTRADGSQASNVYHLVIGADGNAEACERTPEQAESQQSANEKSADVSRGAQNETLGCQNDRGPSHQCKGGVSPVRPLEPPRNQYTPLPPSGDGKSEARAETDKRKRRSRRRQVEQTLVEGAQFIERGTEPWKAWAAYEGREPAALWNGKLFKHGRVFRSKWPPGHALAAPSQGCREVEGA